MISFLKPELCPACSFSKNEIELLHSIIDKVQLDKLRFAGKISTDLAHQWTGREKIKLKLPSFYNNPNIVLPPSINLEQCSSEITAKFKASLFHGNIFLDVTGGLGIDAFYFGKKFKNGFVVERNDALKNLVLHNFKCLNQTNVQFLFGIEVKQLLEEWHQKVDLIFVDPARRSLQGGKIFKLQDCEPNILELLSDLFERTSSILLKTSPMLDIELACSSLQHVKNVYVISVQNECKELLFHLEKNNVESVQIHAVDLDEHFESKFSFMQKNESQFDAQIGELKKYLYEPNASIMKAGGFKSIAHQFIVNSLHINSHLYTSDNFIDDFPGRKFEVIQQLKVDKKNLKMHLPEMKANLSVRNFPDTVNSLRKKLGLQDGGEHYIFATTLHDDSKVLLLLKKVKLS